MPDLVSLTELKTFLGVSGSTDDTLLTDLLEHLESVFEAATGRRTAPFQAAANNVTERKDGTGTEHLFLDYPISAVDSVALGHNSASPDETLSPTNADQLVFTAGSRRLTRTDGSMFGEAGQPRYVHVQYDTQADLPEDAQLAIKRAVAAVYRQRGSEDAASENIGTYQRELSHLVAEDPLWLSTVAAHRRLVLA